MQIVIPPFTYTPYIAPRLFFFFPDVGGGFLYLVRRHMASLKADQIPRSFEKLISK